MKVAVIGATGKAGKLIAREAKRRGYEVTAVTRPASIHRLEDNYPVIPKDIFELTTDDFRGFDVVVDAFGTNFGKPGNENEHVLVMEHLIEVMEPLPEVRLMVVGGAASLFKDETRTRRLIDDMAPEFSVAPRKMYDAYLKLAASKVNYTFMSPAEFFDAGSKGVGTYTLGTDVAIKNAMNMSYITYEDYAIAMVDEMENKSFIRARFTAVSESRFKNDGKNFIPLGMNAFTRQGSWFGIFNAGFGGGYGSTKLYIGSRRDGALRRIIPSSKLFDISPIYQGHKVPCSVLTTPTELLIRTQHGNIRVCFPEESLMLFKSENGLGLRLDGNLTSHEIMKPRGKHSWEAVFLRTASLVFTPWKGKADIHADWDWEKLSTPIVKGDFLPDESGELLLSVEDFDHAGVERDSLYSYDEGLAMVKADWEAFLNKQPMLDARYVEEREKSAWMTWTHLMSPSGRIKRPFMYMGATFCASEWQMCENAVVLKNNLPVAIELMLNMLDWQSPDGQLADLYGDGRAVLGQIKPPVQGWALDILMREHDFAKEVPRDKLEWMYEGYGKWADWFMLYRDNDHDGIPNYEHGDETGNDGTAITRDAHMVELPDLCAFLGLLYEYVGKLGQILGKDPAECESWFTKSRNIIQMMIEKFWNGQRFIGLVDGTHEVIDTAAIMFYRPLVLGKRLPQEIIDKMAADLSEEGNYLSPYGLLSQSLTSRDFSMNGYGNGGPSASENLLIATGLYAAGKTELAKEISRRFCDGMKLGGSPFFGVMPGFMGSWGAAGFQILANVACNM